MEIKHFVTEKTVGKTIRNLLKYEYKMSSGLIRRLKFSGRITVNGDIVRVTHVLKIGEIVIADLYMNDDDSSVLINEGLIDLLYEDDHMICINKPNGICTHPVKNYPDGTLANFLKYYFDSKNISLKIRPVSRLDKNTSGIIMFAKNEYIQDLITVQKPFKEYIAIVRGKIGNLCGSINKPIIRKTLIERDVGEIGQEALTNYEVLASSDHFSLLKIHLATGRTHQIRVHFKSIGHPLVGDDLYSSFDDTDIINRQALHSYSLTFIHPIYKYKVSIFAPIPEDIQIAMDRCSLTNYRKQS